MRSVAVRVAFSMCTYSFLGSTLATLGVRSLQSSLRACGPHHSQLAGAFWQHKAGCQLHDCIARLDTVQTAARESAARQAAARLAACSATVCGQA